MKRQVQKHSKFVARIFQVLENYIPKSTNNLLDNDFLNNPIFIALMQNPPGVFCILNIQTRDYVYVSPNVKKLFGVEPADLVAGGLSLGITYLPVEQQQVFAEKLFPHMMQTCETYAARGEVKDLRFSYTTFIQSASGDTRSCMHQITIMEEDHNKQPLLAFKFIFDINFFKRDANLDYEVSSYSKKDNCYKSIYNTSFLCTVKNNRLTSREKQILQLIGEGKSSKEIADTFCLSRYTVENHRRNMMRKFEVSNTRQLLNTISKQSVLL